jgi:hypothetical protein
MRELHISVVFHRPATRTDVTIYELACAKRPDANQNCIICRVAPEVSDEAAVEKVREYFLTERKNQPGEIELRLGHNERKEMPHHEAEAKLNITPTMTWCSPT